MGATQAAQPGELTSKINLTCPDGAFLMENGVFLTTQPTFTATCVAVRDPSTLRPSSSLVLSPEFDGLTCAYASCDVNSTLLMPLPPPLVTGLDPTLVPAMPTPTSLSRPAPNTANNMVIYGTTIELTGTGCDSPSAIGLESV